VCFPKTVLIPLAIQCQKAELPFCRIAILYLALGEREGVEVGWIAWADF